ncbi:MAG: ABC transporter ATP-binding protein [Gemmatimonadota bacterium]
MTRHPALRLDGLEVRFGDRPGLAPLSFAVKRGERLAVVGTSGAGKSSLLRTIAGLQPHGAGSVFIEGRDCTDLPPEGRGSVYLHQTPLLFPHLNVSGNVAFPLRVRKLPRAVIQRRVRDVLHALGVADLAARTPASLSGGQRHRVALARAIAAQPPVLLLDEPLASLDPPLRAEARDAILNATNDYAPAVILVTHDLAEAGWLADRIGVILDGRLAQLTSPDILFTRPVSPAVASFVGFSNRLDGIIDDGGIFRAGPLALPLPTNFNGPAVLLFRPEAVRVTGEGSLQARVLDVHFAPGTVRLHLRLNELEFQAECTLPSSRAISGGIVAFELDPQHLVLFPAST